MTLDKVTSREPHFPYQENGGNKVYQAKRSARYRPKDLGHSMGSMTVCGTEQMCRSLVRVLAGVQACPADG